MAGGDVDEVTEMRCTIAAFPCGMRGETGLWSGSWQFWRNDPMASLPEDKVIITVATTGGVANTRERNINVPSNQVKLHKLHTSVGRKEPPFSTSMHVIKRESQPGSGGLQ